MIGWAHDKYSGEWTRRLGQGVLLLVVTQTDDEFVWGVHSDKTIDYGGGESLDEAKSGAEKSARRLLNGATNELQQERARRMSLVDKKQTRGAECHSSSDGYHVVEDGYCDLCGARANSALTAAEQAAKYIQRERLGGR